MVKARPTKAASVGEKDKAKEPTRVQPTRTVKTKEYREAHRISWSVHTHHLPKDPNNYYAMTLSALVQLRSEKTNATLPRVLEIVKSKVVAGAFSVRYKVRAAIQKMLESGRATINSRGIIALTSKRSAPKRTVAKRTTAKRTTTDKKKKTTKKKATSSRQKKAANKAAPTKRGRSKQVEVEEAPAAKKRNRGKAKDAALQYRWEYKERDNWFPYAKEASDVVEAAYQTYLADPNQVDVRSVKSGMWSYQVDFTNMTQTNIQHDNHTVRDIRRSAIPSE